MLRISHEVWQEIASSLGQRPQLGLLGLWICFDTTHYTHHQLHILAAVCSDPNKPGSDLKAGLSVPNKPGSDLRACTSVLVVDFKMIFVIFHRDPWVV